MTKTFVLPLMVAAMSLGGVAAASGQSATETPVSPATEHAVASARAVDRAIADEIATRFQGNRTQLLEFLRVQAKTMKAYRQEWETRLAPSARFTPTFAEVAEEKVHLRLIQLNRRQAETDEPLRARGGAVRARLQAGENFGDVAKEVSEDLRAAKGGDWGWVTRSDLKPEFEEVAFGLKKGEMSTPLVRPEGCFLLWVEDRH